MRLKGSLFALGTICVLLCGAITFSRSYQKVFAEEAVDLGNISFSLKETNNKDKNGFYLIGPANDIPVSWENSKFSSNETTAILLDGSPIGNTNFKLTKHDETGYYLSLNDGGYGYRTKNETFTLQGNWSGLISGVTYTMNIKPIVVTWTGKQWKSEFVMPELQDYDKVTLTNASYDDFDRTIIDRENTPSVWNTFATSIENTTNSFAFEFIFESYGDMGTSASPKTLDIRIGSNGNWDVGHFYKLILCNVWGTQGVILLREQNGETIISSSENLNCNLLPGARHTIEFGSIYVKDSTQTFDYVMYDGNYLYRTIKEPCSDERTTKIGISCLTNNIFIGSSMGQKANDTTLSFNHADGNLGIYLDGDINDIPVHNRDVVGVPASRYNAMVNGNPLFEYGENYPLVKLNSGDKNSYYLSLGDSNAIFEQGDVVTLSDEFHFRWENKTYSMSINPVAFVYNNRSFEPINNINEYLCDKLEEHINRDYYNDSGLEDIDTILTNASTTLSAITNMKQLWDSYYDFIDVLDSVPFDAEKGAPVLEPAKTAAINRLNSFVDEDIYDEENIIIVQGYVNTAIGNINAATSIAQINQIVSDTEELIAGVTTKQEAIESKIMATEDGFEKYLASYDVVTTTDLCAIGEMEFNSNSSYSSGDLSDFTARVATKKDNAKGNMIFQFNYQSNNPSSNRYGAQVYIRLRGTDVTCYRYNISMSVEDGYGVGLNAVINDKVIPGSEKAYNAGFVANESYKIECGSIDLKDYNRTFVFIKVNGEFVIKNILDSLPNEPEPTIRIFDSFTGVDGIFATLSAAEEGTTKDANASLLGRLKLDDSSNKDLLRLSLRKNNIPAGTNLYPLENSAFTINGEKIDAYRPTTYLTKVSDNKYEVHFDYELLQDGDTIALGGCFAAFDQIESKKTVCRLFETEFIYNEETNSWRQQEVDLTENIDDAKELLSRYVDLSNYSETNQSIINEIISSYSSSIDSATTNEQVQQLLEEALSRIDAISTILMDYKASAKEELQSYKPASLFREEEQRELAKILTGAFENIDNCNDKESIDFIVEQAKNAIDGIKTAAQRDIEDLADAKRLGKADIEAYVGLLEMDRYSDENINAIQSLALKARKDVDNATSIEEVNQIINAFKEQIKNIQTKDGSIFDGEKYLNPNKNDWVLPVAIGGGVAAAGGIAAAVIFILKKKGILFVKK